MDSGRTIVIQTPDKKGWFWYVPLMMTSSVSVLVASYHYLCESRFQIWTTIYMAEVESLPGVSRESKGRDSHRGYKAQKEYSYGKRREGRR